MTPEKQADAVVLRWYGPRNQSAKLRNCLAEAIREAHRDGQSAMLERCVADCKQTKKNLGDSVTSEQALGALLCWQSLCHVEVERWANR